MVRVSLENPIKKRGDYLTIPRQGKIDVLLLCGRLRSLLSAFFTRGCRWCRCKGPAQAVAQGGECAVVFMAGASAVIDGVEQVPPLLTSPGRSTPRSPLGRAGGSRGAGEAPLVLTNLAQLTFAPPLIPLPAAGTAWAPSVAGSG